MSLISDWVKYNTRVSCCLTMNTFTYDDGDNLCNVMGSGVADLDFMDNDNKLVDTLKQLSHQNSSNVTIWTRNYQTMGKYFV